MCVFRARTNKYANYSKNIFKIKVIFSLIWKKSGIVFLNFKKVYCDIRVIRGFGTCEEHLEV